VSTSAVCAGLAGSGQTGRGTHAAEYIHAMSRSRRYLVIATSVLMLAACSNRSEGQATEPRQPSSAPGSPAPASTRASAFCLDLGTLQFAVTHYVAEVGQAIEGEPLDFKELRRQSDNIARIGKPMRADAPADIREELGVVLDAVAATKSKLRADGSARELLDPLYGAKNRSAFEAVHKYDCPE